VSRANKDAENHPINPMKMVVRVQSDAHELLAVLGFLMRTVHVVNLLPSRCSIVSFLYLPWADSACPNGRTRVKYRAGSVVYKREEESATLIAKRNRTYNGAPRIMHDCVRNCLLVSH
jgi:hypothetical protein